MSYRVNGLLLTLGLFCELNCNAKRIDYSLDPNITSLQRPNLSVVDLHFGSRDFQSKLKRFLSPVHWSFHFLEGFGSQKSGNSVGKMKVMCVFSLCLHSFLQWWFIYNSSVRSVHQDLDSSSGTWTCLCQIWIGFTGINSRISQTKTYIQTKENYDLGRVFYDRISTSCSSSLVST